MEQVFDVIEAIMEKVGTYYDEQGILPASISISPRSYRRMLQIKSDETEVGNSTGGCAPITEIHTPLGIIQLQLDEIMSDTDVEVT